MLATLAVVPRKIQKRRQHFVKVPWTWIERLATARYIATYRVALHMLYRHWKRAANPSHCQRHDGRWKASSGEQNGAP